MITRILIVDRNIRDLEQSKKLLRETGKFEFSECKNAEEMMKIEKPNFDLVILELNNESETIIRHLLKTTKEKVPRFILCSSGYDEKYTSSLTTLGIQLEFIDKPIQPNVLTKRISYIFSSKKSNLQTSLMKSEINKLNGLTENLSKHQKNVEDEISHFKKKVSVPIQSVISQILNLVNQKQDLDQEGMIDFLKKLMNQLHGDLYKPIFRDIEETLSENERRWLTESFNIPAVNVNETPVTTSKLEDCGVADYILFHKNPTKPFPSEKTRELPYTIKKSLIKQPDSAYRPVKFNTELLEKTEFLRKLSYCPFEYQPKELQMHVLLMFQSFDLFRLYGIPVERFKELLIELHLRYLGNPYHNFYHSVDVCQFIFFLVSEIPSRASHDYFTTFDVLVLLLSALFHDIDHPGRNNNFLIAADHVLSLRYNGISVLENHHCCEMFKLLLSDEYNLFPNFPREKWDKFRKDVIDTILSTDMKNHFNFMAEFSATFPKKKKFEEEKEEVEGEEEEEGEGEGEESKEGGGDGKDKQGVEGGQAVPKEGGPVKLVSKKFEEERLTKKRSVKILLMQLIMKAADICNQVRPFLFAKRWSVRCLDEFFAQGDMEKKLGFPVNMLGDRDKVSTPDSQVKFIRFIVYPLFEQLENALGGTCEGIFTDKLTQNSETWETFHRREMILRGKGVNTNEVEIKKINNNKKKEEEDEFEEEKGDQVSEVDGSDSTTTVEKGDDNDEEEEEKKKEEKVVEEEEDDDDDDDDRKRKRVSFSQNVLQEEDNGGNRLRKRRMIRNLRKKDRNQKGKGVELNEEEKVIEEQTSCFQRCINSLELEEYEFYTISYAIIGVAFMFAIFRFLIWSSGGDDESGST